MNVTFLRRWREKLHFGGETGEEVLQEEQCILQKDKQGCELWQKKKKLDTGFFSFVINYFLPDRYSVEEASGRHEGSTPEEPDPTQDTCELPSLSAEDQKHKGGHSRDQTRPGFMRRGSAGLLTILE